MPPESNEFMTASPLDQLVTLLCVLEGDRAVELDERQARDRAIGAQLDTALDDRGRLLAWIARVAPSTVGSAARALSSAGTLMFVCGFFIGILAAAAAFYYDGSGRVNVLAVAGLLVGLPLVLLVLSWVSCLAYTRARLWPFFGDIVAGLAQFSPGRATAWLAPRLTREHRAHLALLFGAGVLATDPPVLKVRTWFFARWSHLVGTGYFLGVLLGMAALVVFTDLVFGWSTTLTVTGARLHALVTQAALPWSWAWSEAVPSLALVEASQYYRAGNAVTEQETLARLGQWWRFLLMLTLVYGFLPRLVSVMITSRNLFRRADRALVELRQSAAVLERMQPVVSGRSDHTPAPPVMPMRAEAPNPVSHLAFSRELRAHLVINWSGLPVSEARLLADFGAEVVRLAGGTRSLAQDNQLIREIAALGSDPIVLVCKAWEPPLLELRDFVDDLRQATDAEIKVTPVAVEAGRVAPAAIRDREVWQCSLDIAQVEVGWLEVPHP
jgi:hypothetical protein